jgi:hypothetical protein
MEVYGVRDRFSRNWRAALVALFVPVGALLALLVGTAAGPAAATAAGGPTATAATTTTTTTTTTSSTTTTSTTPPIAVTGCNAYLTPATPTLLDSNYLNYNFQCDGTVTAYTVIINRQHQYDNEVDDFSQNSSVTQPGSTTSLNVAFTCSGEIPGAGVNCFAGAGAAAPQWTWIQGQLDTTTPFCPTLPKHAKPGTKPTPEAQAEIVVTDGTGAQTGPYYAPIGPACKKLKPVPKPKPKPKAKHHAKHNGG